MKYYLIIFALLFVGHAGASASDIGEVVKTSCSSCHNTARVCAKLGQRDAETWKMTIMRMKANGARLPAERVDEAAAYLGGLEPGNSSLCN